jgi:quinolinate synthase
VPVVAYVNTSAAVKAEVDVCCTSANAVEIVESLGSDEVVLVPDRHLSAWVAGKTSVKIHSWDGACEVHDRFKGTDVEALRALDPELVVLAHPECPPDVIAAADDTTSTSGMARIVATRKPKRVALITECSMADNLRSLHPEVDFVPACGLCPHMQRITLDGIADALALDRHRIEVDAAVAERARASIERMLAVPVG